MTSARASRLLRALLYLGGATAGGAGTHTALAGARSVPGKPRANAIVESELRYYSGFYAAYGLALIRIAGRPERATGAVQAAAGALFGAGVARTLAWRAAGRPHPGQVALLAIELAAPPAIVLLQRRAGGQEESGRAPNSVGDRRTVA
jgi:Domain of unknown function (DUF4345)